MTIPVYTAMTAEQAADWIERCSARAQELLLQLHQERQQHEVKPADATMSFLLAAMGTARVGGFKLREFLAVLEMLGVA